MSRPIRIEFGGALYHVTSRGDRRESIYEDDTDREHFLDVLGDTVVRFNWLCHAYCLMDNHYHAVIATPDGNLSKGMRQLNGVYTQWSNRRHGRIGHLFQGRFKAILVDADSYLLELTRYVVLHPVRARMVRRPRDWKWSSYRATIGEVDAPPWLDTDGLLAQFGSRRPSAVQAYARFVHEGIGADSIWIHLNRQVFLGNDAFVTRALKRSTRSEDVNIPRAQRRPPAPTLAAIAQAHRDRETAMRAAWTSIVLDLTPIYPASKTCVPKPPLPPTAIAQDGVCSCGDPQAATKNGIMLGAILGGVAAAVAVSFALGPEAGGPSGYCVMMALAGEPAATVAGVGAVGAVGGATVGLGGGAYVDARHAQACGCH